MCDHHFCTCGLQGDAADAGDLAQQILDNGLVANTTHDDAPGLRPGFESNVKSAPPHAEVKWQAIIPMGIAMSLKFCILSHVCSHKPRSGQRYLVHSLD